MLAKAGLPGTPSKLLNLLGSKRRVTGCVGQCRNQTRQLSRMETAKAALKWRSTGRSQSRNITPHGNARRPTLNLKHNIWELYCISREQHSSVVFFYEMNGRAYTCLLLRKYRSPFLSQFLNPGRVRLRAEGDRGSESYSLPAAWFDSVVSRSHPRTPPAGWAGTDFLATEQNSITFPSFG